MASTLTITLLLISSAAALRLRTEGWPLGNLLPSSKCDNMMKANDAVSFSAETEPHFDALVDQHFYRFCMHSGGTRTSDGDCALKEQNFVDMGTFIYNCPKDHVHKKMAAQTGASTTTVSLLDPPMVSLVQSMMKGTFKSFDDDKDGKMTKEDMRKACAAADVDTNDDQALMTFAKKYMSYDKAKQAQETIKSGLMGNDVMGNAGLAIDMDTVRFQVKLLSYFCSECSDAFVQKDLKGSVHEKTYLQNFYAGWNMFGEKKGPKTMRSYLDGSGTAEIEEMQAFADKVDAGAAKLQEQRQAKGTSFAAAGTGKCE